MRNGKMNIIYCGECSSIMKKYIPDDLIDLTVTSPPYDNLREYKGYVFDFEAIAQQLWRVTKLGGVVVWVVGDATINGSETLTSFKQALYFKELGFNVHDTMIYKSEKPPLTHSRYEQKFEYMFVFSNGQPRAFNPILENTTYYKESTKRPKSVKGSRSQNSAWRSREDSPRIKRRKIKGNVWEYKTGGGSTSNDKYAFNHPAIFPEVLVRDHIISWSNPSDIVLDPLCGSGTTLKMAKEQDRQYIGIDISQEYCDLSQWRVNGARVPLPGIFDV